MALMVFHLPPVPSCRQASPGTVPPELKPQLELIGSVCRRLSERLMTALDAALGSGHQLLTSCHQRQLRPGGWSVLRLLHYPPVTGDTGSSQQVTRCGAHTDFSTLTLLFQHGVRGLQVRPETRHVQRTLLRARRGITNISCCAYQVRLSRHEPKRRRMTSTACAPQVQTSDGQWISADPIPGTILVNIGYVTELVTGGRLRATYHRVPLPQDQQAWSTSRQAMAFFVQPDGGTTVAPPDGETRYQPMDFNNFAEKMFAAVYPSYRL